MSDEMMLYICLDGYNLSFMQPITDYFQDTAYRLGYKPEDLLPITRESVEAESIAFTKGMSEKERDYYINRKVVTLLQRQNKIIG